LDNNYNNILSEFTKYLITIGYGDCVCYNTPNMISHFLSFVQKPVEQITKNDVDCFIDHLQSKVSTRTQNKLSNSHINGYIICLKRFSKFVFQMYRYNITVEHLLYLKVDTPEKSTLTIDQIKSLFDVCDNTKLGYRDKAMLSLYYSCGLRRSEVLHIQLCDIDFDANVLFVRKGKGDKQRYVPFTQSTHSYLRDYINIGRRRLNRKHKFRNTLLISYRGDKVKAQALQLRVNTLCKRAEITQKVGLHTLRHSIATHLLQQNMSIYDISEFLGHSSLESTQIYTHIINE
jgi:integrase/recombinase XerD